MHSGKVPMADLPMRARERTGLIDAPLRNPFGWVKETPRKLTAEVSGSDTVGHKEGFR
jgi:hypothetical protein